MDYSTKLSNKEKYSFAIAGFGQNMVITFTTTFMLVYLYNFVGFSLSGIATLTAIIGAAKIWDALNDFIMGMLVDYTHTRWGKLRPYILLSAFPIALLTILLFAIPQTTETYKLIFFCYCLHLMGYGLYPGRCPLLGTGRSHNRKTGRQSRNYCISKDIPGSSTGHYNCPQSLDGSLVKLFR